MATSDPDAQTIVALDIGLGFVKQGQRVWRIDIGAIGRLAVDQPMQQVQHMRLRRYARIQSQFHSPDDDLFVVMKNESKDIDHLTITARAAKHLVLQPSKGQRQFQEGRTIAQGTRFALDDRKVMPPVVNRSRRFVVAAFYDPRMFAEDIALGRNDQPLGIDPQADGPVGKRCRHTVAVPLEGNQAGR